MSDTVSCASSSQRKHAWHVALLANSQYTDENKNLPGVMDDARQLEDCEFFRSAPSKVRWDNLTFEETRLKVTEWCERWGDNQQVMFFFLGHGAYSVEKRARCMLSADGWWIDLINLQDYVQTRRGVCFGAYFACCQDVTRNSELVRPLFPMASPLAKHMTSEAFLHFACRPGQTMDDGPEDMSKYVTEYTAYLIKILCNGNCVSEIPLYLQEKVNAKTAMHQCPDYLSSILRDRLIWDDGEPIGSLSSFEQGTFSASRLGEAESPCSASG